ncbi:MAG: bacteriocin [Spirochaetaceae bacterium]|nr:MAG: bacteriocin [Spirochaetaceae bacterium]
MDMLRKQLAPICDAAWREIEEQAVRFLTSTLAVRRFADVVGPLGVEYAAVPTGRLSLPPDQASGGAKYGVSRVQPLVEARVSFELNIWELDNVARGADDVDLSALEKAAWELARFEEESIYAGLAPAGIEPLSALCAHAPQPYGGKAEQLFPAVVSGLTTLRKAMIEGPYALVVPEQPWNYLMSTVQGRPLSQHVETVLGGPVIFSPFVPSPLLVSLRGGDMQLIIGRDIDIGYTSHTAETVHLYFTETFTFRVLDPSVYLFLT